MTEFENIIKDWDNLHNSLINNADKEREFDRAVDKMINAYDSVRREATAISKKCDDFIENNADAKEHEILTIKNANINMRYFMAVFSNAIDILKQMEEDLANAYKAVD